MFRKHIIAIVVLTIGLTLPAFAAHKLTVTGNRIVLDGKRGHVTYRSRDDLDGDGRIETTMAVQPDDGGMNEMVVARQLRGVWQLLAEEEDQGYYLRTDVTDINGDRKPEIVERYMSGDGHWVCEIYSFTKGRLVSLGWFFNVRLRDLTGDGIPELLSLEPIVAMSFGDHWLTIHKWNGRGYTDVSRRFPRMYDSVIKDLRDMIFQARYGRLYGPPSEPSDNPYVFAELYYYLGKAYEYRGLPAKAKTQYAIAYRLDPRDEGIVAAFRRTWKTK